MPKGIIRLIKEAKAQVEEVAKRDGITTFAFFKKCVNITNFDSAMVVFSASPATELASVDNPHHLSILLTITKELEAHAAIFDAQHIVQLQVWNTYLEGKLREIAAKNVSEVKQDDVVQEAKEEEVKKQPDVREEKYPDSVTGYHRRANKFKSSSSIRPLKEFIKDAIGKEPFASMIPDMPVRVKEMLIKAFMLGNGEKIKEALMVSGLASMLLKAANARLSIRFGEDDLRRLAEHDRDGSKYLNSTMQAIIKALLKDSSPAARIEILKAVAKSCPESIISIKTKRNIIIEIDSHAEKGIMDLAYDAPVPSIAISYFSQVNLSKVDRVLALELDHSQFITMMCGVIRGRPGSEDVVRELENNYFQLKYTDCVRRIVQFVTQDMDFPLRHRVLAKVDALVPVKIDKNHTRLYFETKLAQYYFGTQVQRSAASFNKIAHYFNAKYQVGVPVDEKMSPSALGSGIERLVLSITNAEKLVGFLQARQEGNLKKESKQFKTKGREYRTGVITRKDLRKKDQAGSTVLLSRQLGLMKAHSPFYPDELAPQDQMNRSTDVHTYSLDPHNWPLQNPHVPFVASLSGHAYFIVGILEDYMKSNSSDPDLSQDINAFLTGVIAAYIKNSYHSAFEIIAILREPRIQKLFHQYDVQLNPSFFAENVMTNAMEYATQYTLDHCYKQIVHAELVSEEKRKPLRSVRGEEKKVEEKKDGVPRSKDDLIPKVVAEIKNIFQNFYLATVDVVDESAPLTGLRKKLTSIQNAFSSGAKITKSQNNPKILLIKEISASLDEIMQHTSMSDKVRLHQINLMMKKVYEKYKNQKGNFAKAVNYINEYLENILNAAPSVSLDVTSREFRELEEKFVADAGAAKKESMRFEPSRVFKQGSNPVANVLREMTTKPPEFGGEDEFIVVQRIQRLENAELQAKYQKAKGKIKSSSGPISESKIGLDVGSLSGQLDHSVNEVFLYHGTSLAVSRLISRYGFNSAKFCAYSQSSGYGPLGRGTYFTDELPKAGTFAMCGLCGSHRCVCKTSDGTLIPKVTFVCRIALGNTEVVTKKSRNVSHSTTPQSGCHSRVGLSKRVNSQSEFNSNEIAVADDHQIYPEYAVFYHHYKNMLKPSVWEREIAEAGIDRTNSFIVTIDRCIKKFATLLEISSGNAIRQLELLASIKANVFLFLKEANPGANNQRIFEIIKLQCDHYSSQLRRQLGIGREEEKAMPAVHESQSQPEVPSDESPDSAFADRMGHSSDHDRTGEVKIPDHTDEKAETDASVLEPAEVVDIHAMFMQQIGDAVSEEDVQMALYEWSEIALASQAKMDEHHEEEKSRGRLFDGSKNFNASLIHLLAVTKNYYGYFNEKFDELASFGTTKQSHTIKEAVAFMLEKHPENTVLKAFTQMIELSEQQLLKIAGVKKQVSSS